MNSSQVLIYLSTCIVYEGCNQFPVTEQTLINEEKLSTYGKSFYFREKKLQSIKDGPKCIGLRLGTVIGVSPMQNITRVYIAMLRDAFLKGVIKVQNPNCMRSILDIWDLYDVIQTIIKANLKYSNIYNISSFNTSMLEIASEISKYTEDKIIIESSQKSPVDFIMDTSLFNNHFNFVFKGTHKTIIEELLKNITHICKDDIKKYTHVSTCRICQSRNLMPILDLNEQPLANNFTFEKNDLKKFPLLLERCRNCNHTQLNYIVSPEEMFSHYLYASGTSKTIVEYFTWLAKKCTDEATKITNNVLELASNDGTQLDCFKLLGWNTYGVDPAVNISKMAIEKGHHIYNGFWGVNNFSIPIPDIIIAQNVFAHVPDPVLFIKACVEIMTDNTKLYIQTSQCNMYITGEFDTIYHEHLSFFTGHSFKKIADISGLNIINFETTPIHGTSFLVTMQKGSEKTHCQQLWERINYEKNLGMDEDFFWIRYRCKAYNVIEWLKDNYFPLKDKYTLAAYGAAAKGMTLLNHINLPYISFIVDDSTLKQNTFSPGQNIPVLPTLYLEKNKNPLAILILAWNFFDEIVKNIRKLRANCTTTTLVIRPFPKQIIYSLTESGLQEITSQTIYYRNILNPQKINDKIYIPEKMHIECVHSK